MIINCGFPECIQACRSSGQKEDYEKRKKPKTKTVKQKKVKPQKIKQKKVKAPKYIPVKPVFGTAEDYYIYRLNPVETATGALLGGIVGFFFSMVFFRNVIFSLIVGLLLVVPGIRKYRDYLKDKRMKNLLYQFRDMMESLPHPIPQVKIPRELFWMPAEI